MLSVRVVLLVDGQFAAWLQLLLRVHHADVIDDGNLLLGVLQQEGPHPVEAMPYEAMLFELRKPSLHTARGLASPAGYLVGSFASL